MSHRAVPPASLVAVVAVALAAGAVAASSASAQGASGPGDTLTMIVPVSIGPGDPVSGARVQAIDPITKRAVSTAGTAACMLVWRLIIDGMRTAPNADLYDTRSAVISGFNCSRSVRLAGRSCAS